MALELNAATFGLLPEPGGLYDQDARFVDALRTSYEALAEATKPRGRK